MSVKIISGPEWLPLKIQEGLSEQRRFDAFAIELAEFGGKVFHTKLKLPLEESFTLYHWYDSFVHVHESVLERFKEKFAPFLKEGILSFDNLINICVMVKNGGEDFRNMLTKNLPYMDRYTILDTGSTDNTVEIAREVLKNKRGEIYEEPFINFRDSRNRLLELASDHCHFNIMLDDSYVLHGPLREFLDTARGDDIADSFSLVIEDQDTMYTSCRVTKPPRGLRYINIIHEIIDQKDNLNVAIPYKDGYIEDVNSDHMRARTDARKLHDIELLMQSDPETNPRTCYYVADSYLYLKDWEKALHWFKKRAKMGGYKGEFQDALYYIAVLKDLYLHHPWEECHDCYLRCYEADPKRADVLYFLGQHYHRVGMNNTAFMYWKKAFHLGLPDIQMSVRKNIYHFHLPADLASLCYEQGDSELGEQACRRALEHRDDTSTDKWLHIFYHMNQAKLQPNRTRVNDKKLICFVSPGGWREWDGETYRTRGLGGSETFTVCFAEALSKLGYAVAVFCKCGAQREYEGVTYLPDTMFCGFIGRYIVDVCIINRFPEFIPAACQSGAKTYFVMHDRASSEEIIPMPSNFASVLCISEWHRKQLFSSFPMCQGRTQVASYGIDTTLYTQTEKEKYMFIYPNFPNRGLVHLLRMWDKIVTKYPRAHLHTFCNTQNRWCQEHWKEDMVEVDRLFERHKDTVTNHGWVNGKTLRSYWQRANVWFYPCTFEETCCLTAWEAAASRTLAVTNNLAALAESVGDRGVITHGNVSTVEWQQEALRKLFDVLDNNREGEYTQRNYEWVLGKDFTRVIPEFNQRFIVN